jgi:hypothetical protein
MQIIEKKIRHGSITARWLWCYVKKNYKIKINLD